MEELDKLIKGLISGFLYVVMPAFIVYLVVTFLIQFVLVSGNSMAPTLQDKDCLIVNKAEYETSDPLRYDIVVFKYGDSCFIKRIIGLPGETINIELDGKIRIDGRVIEENYGIETIREPGIAYEPIKLGEDEYFVLGDNRNNSSDSRLREIGPVKKDQIVGRAYIRIYPFNKMTLFK